jgi:hypothetical protein
MRIAKSPSELGFNRYDEPRLAKALERVTDKRIFQRLQAVLLVAHGLTADEVAVIENVRSHLCRICRGAAAHRQPNK